MAIYTAFKRLLSIHATKIYKFKHPSQVSDHIVVVWMEMCWKLEIYSGPEELYTTRTWNFVLQLWKVSSILPFTFYRQNRLPINICYSVNFFRLVHIYWPTICWTFPWIGHIVMDIFNIDYSCIYSSHWIVRPGSSWIYYIHFCIVKKCYILGLLYIN